MSTDIKIQAAPTDSQALPTIQLVGEADAGGCCGGGCCAV
ncbi:MAG: hypothetical protein JWQ59_2064 [Cryobacterium sp.]|jgi:hypothetical protein|nr:hypothetical protein [Cryobacterium sp.]